MRYSHNGATLGTPYEGGKREKVRVDMTAAQALSIIDRLPERSEREGYRSKR